MNYMYMEEIISKDPTVKKVETIDYWTNLVLTYARIYLSAHPAETIEPLKYIQTVRRGVNRGSYMYLLEEV